MKMKLVIEDAELASKVQGGGQPLLDVCVETVRGFDRYLRSSPDPAYRDGLASWEFRACVGMLYQMYRGRIEPDIKVEDPKP